MGLRYVSCALTHVGHIRDNNEDSFFADDALGLYIVADGMGGHAAGEVASAMAIDQILGMVRQEKEKIATLAADPNEVNRRAVGRLLEAAIQAATYFVFSMADLSPEQRGMGTTISAMVTAGNSAVIGQVGDSRAYLLRGKKLTQLTEDHTLVNFQLKSGEITAEQAAHAQNRNIITRAVGILDYVEVDTFDVSVKRGDRFLLCSDGLHDYADTPDDLVVNARAKTLPAAAEGLIQFALASGGKDNITVVLIEAVK